MVLEVAREQLAPPVQRFVRRLPLYRDHLDAGGQGMEEPGAYSATRQEEDEGRAEVWA
jgi:hypothetical protein